MRKCIIYKKEIKEGKEWSDEDLVRELHAQMDALGEDSLTEQEQILLEGHSICSENCYYDMI